MADVDIGLGLDTKEAERGLDQFQSRLKKGIAAISAGFAAIKIGEFLADGIKEAIEAEKALNKLSTQLKITGEFSKEAVAGFSDFADSLERATNVSAESVLEQTALAKSFGLSNEASKELVQAATQLSAITGDDLSTSVDTLIKSYQGQTKQLSKVIGETATLTKEQLKNGAAIDLINSKYAGTAEAGLNTYSGALIALQRSFGDISKEIGVAVIENDRLIAVIRAVTGAFEDVIDFLANNKGQISSFVSVLIGGFFGAAKAVTGLASVIERVLGAAVLAVTVPLEGLIGVFESLSRVGGKTTENISNGLQDANVFLKNFNSSAIKGVSENTGAFAIFNEKLVEVQKSIKSVGSSASETSNIINRSAENRKPFIRSEDIEAAKRSYKSLSDEIFNSVATETEKVNAKRREQLEQLETIRKLDIISLKEFNETKIKINEAAEKQITEISQREADKRTLEQKRVSGGVSGQQPQTTTVVGPDGKPVVVNLNADAAEKALVSGLSTGANVITAALNGRDGAVQMASTIGAGIADTFLPGFGQAVGPLITALTQESDTLRESIREFFAALDDVVIAIIEGILILIQEIVLALGRALAQFLTNFGAGINKFFAGLQEFFKGFAEALKEIFNGVANVFKSIFEGVIDFFSNIFEKLSDSLANLGSTIFNAIIDGAQGMVDSIVGAFDSVVQAFKDLFKPITDAFGGGGGGDFFSDTANSIAGVFGFAEGGVVPPGFPNDTYPAFLTSGETVIPPGKPLPDTTGNSEVMVALLGKILTKLSEPITTTATAEVNGRALAEIILQLNRNNARLAI